MIGFRERVSKAAAAAALLSFGLAGAADATCATRHFYNHSGHPWTLGVSSGTCSMADGAPKVHSCTIAPGQTANIHYTNSSKHESITVESAFYPLTRFSVSTAEMDPNACRIEHNGNTGNIVVNDPAGGDIQTCGNYPCK